MFHVLRTFFAGGQEIEALCEVIHVAQRSLAGKLFAMGGRRGRGRLSVPGKLDRGAVGGMWMVEVVELVGAGAGAWC